MKQARRGQAALGCCAAIAMAWFAGSVHAAGPVVAGDTTEHLPDALDMYVGQALVRSTEAPVKRVAIGSGKLLEVHTIGARQLVLIADGPGDTSLELWFANGTQRSVSVHIGHGNAAQLSDVVRALLGGTPGVTVMPLGGNVVVTGTSLPLDAINRIAAVQKLYPQVISFATANPVQTQPMVLMKVRIMEFKKSSLSELGIQWDQVINGPSGGLVHDWKTNPGYRVYGDSNSGGSGGGDYFSQLSPPLPLRVPGTWSYFGIATAITSKIELMENTGNAWELASPQLAARSGGKADFLVGGEVPIPVSTGLGQTSVTYHDYGIKLNIAPLVGPDGNVQADVSTEVSKIDNSNKVGDYPAFTVDRASSQVDLHSGDTLVISGLLDATGSKAYQKLPGLGDLPILGALFRSRAFQANRTELVIFITPTVIKPDSPENARLIQRSDQMKQDFSRTIGGAIVD